MSDLRAACIHGRYEPHRAPHPNPGWSHPDIDTSVPCPGGREVTIDYEAAYQQYADEYGLKNHEQVRRIIDAAIEGSE